MYILRNTLVVLAVLCASLASGQAPRQEPRIGYLYPAGGRQGSVVVVGAGGQSLAQATEVLISGKGVRATVIRSLRPLFNINREQQYVLVRRMKAVFEARLREAGVGDEQIKTLTEQGDRRWNILKRQDIDPKGVKMPEHLLLYDLEKKSLRELMHIRNVIFFPRQKRQKNRQLAETALLQVTIAADARPGDRALRIRTRRGLTNPMIFQVGQAPEACELEPNDQKAWPEPRTFPKIFKLAETRDLLKQKPLEVPILLNGQIMPGDIDRFRFRAKKGQRLVIEAAARHLVPYLADAVPGWFQATLTLYDAENHEVAFADDYQFHPDPVLLFDVPQDGAYELEIRDAMYRGREDFVYRISVSERPFVTSVFPLGGRAGQAVTASIRGWNLAKTRLRLDTDPNGPPVRQAVTRNGAWVSNPVTYAVDTLPETLEAEPNDAPKEAQRIVLPRMINGRIDAPGDVDTYRIQGRAGERIVAEVYARRLNSPMDSLVRILDASENVLAWNDDNVRKLGSLHIDRSGLITHHADSYVRATLPRDGAYTVQISDAQGAGSPAHAYRLRITAPRPDFALRATPASIDAPPGATVPITVYALRQDGFDGAIDIAVTSPDDVRIAAGRIPKGQNARRMTLTIPPKGHDKPCTLRLAGSARVAGHTVTRTVGAADNVMQAFLYRHLLPAGEIVLAVRRQRWALPRVHLLPKGPLRLRIGRPQPVTARIGAARMLKQLALELHEPPAGITLHDVRVVDDGLTFQLKAEGKSLPVGTQETVLVQVFRQFVPKAKDGKPAKEKRRHPLTFLPAIPIEIVR